VNNSLKELIKQARC